MATSLQVLEKLAAVLSEFDLGELEDVPSEPKAKAKGKGKGKGKAPRGSGQKMAANGHPHRRILVRIVRHGATPVRHSTYLSTPKGTALTAAEKKVLLAAFPSAPNNRWRMKLDAKSLHVEDEDRLTFYWAGGHDDVLPLWEAYDAATGQKKAKAEKAYRQLLEELQEDAVERLTAAVNFLEDGDEDVYLDYLEDLPDYDGVSRDAIRDRLIGENPAPKRNRPSGEDKAKGDSKAKSSPKEDSRPKAVSVAAMEFWA